MIHEYTVRMRIDDSSGTFQEKTIRAFSAEDAHFQAVHDGRKGRPAWLVFDVSPKEGSEPAYACDECCGHGCEDGKCVGLAELRESKARVAELECAERLARATANSKTEALRQTDAVLGAAKARVAQLEAALANDVHHGARILELATANAELRGCFADAQARVAELELEVKMKRNTIVSVLRLVKP